MYTFCFFGCVLLSFTFFLFFGYVFVMVFVFLKGYGARRPALQKKKNLENRTQPSKPWAQQHTPVPAVCYKSVLKQTIKVHKLKKVERETTNRIMGGCQFGPSSPKITLLEWCSSAQSKVAPLFFSPLINRWGFVTPKCWQKMCCATKKEKHSSLLAAPD